MAKPGLQRLRLRAGLLGLCKGIGVLLVWAVALVLSVLVHTSLPSVRQGLLGIVVSSVNAAIYGRVEAEALTELSLHRVSLGHVRLLDEQDRKVIELEQVSLSIDLPSNLKRWYAASATSLIELPHARAERARVWLFEDAEGIPSLARALSSPPKPKRPQETPKSDHPFRAGSIELGSLVVTSDTEGLDALRAHLQQVHGRVVVADDDILIDVERLGLALDGVLETQLRGTGAVHIAWPQINSVELDGFLGDVELHAHGSWSDERLTATLTAPRLSPEAARKHVPNWPLTRAVAAHVQVAGPLSQLNTTFELRSDKANLSGAGELSLSGAPRGVGDVTFEDVDLGLLDTSLPQASLTGQVRLEASPEPFSLRGSGHVVPFEVGGVAVPRVSFDATVMRDHVTASARVEDELSPIIAELDWQPDELRASARIDELDLGRHPRLPRVARGRSALNASAVLKGDVLAVSGKGSAQQLSWSGVRAATVDFQGSAQGNIRELEALNFRGAVRIRNLDTEFISFERAEATFENTPNGVLIDSALSDRAGRAVHARGTIDSQARIVGAQLEVAHRGVVLDAKLPLLDLTTPRVELDTLTITGAGEPLVASGVYSADAVDVQARSEGLLLERVLDALGAGQVAARGTLGLDAHLLITDGVARGHLNAEVSRASYDAMGNVGAHLESVLDGESFTGRFWGVDDSSQIAFGSEWSATLAGDPLELETWERAGFESELAVNNVMLDALALLLDNDAVEDVQGIVGLRVRARRELGETWPSALFELGAQRLTLTLPADPEPRRLSESQLYVAGVLNSQDNTILGSGRVTDPVGQLLGFSYSLNLGLEELLRDPEATLREFRRRPVIARFVLGRRRLQSLPLVLDGELPEGFVTGDLQLTGSTESPSFSLDVDLEDLSSDASPDAPISGKIHADYTANSGQLVAHLDAEAAGQRVARAQVSATVPWTATTGDAEWDAEADLELVELPIRFIPGVSGLGLQGSLTGTATLERGTETRLSAAIDVKKLASGNTQLGSGKLTLNGSGDSIQGALTCRRGTQSLKLDLDATGRKGHLPVVSGLEQLRLRLQARSLSAGALSPVLAGIASRLHGVLDADLTLLVQAPNPASQSPEFKQTIVGTARLERGGAFLPALGVELEDLSASLEAAPSLQGTVLDIRDLAAKARSPNHNLKGHAQLYLAGGTLESATAQLIAQNVPLALEGRALGRASGTADVQLRRLTGWPQPGPLQGKDHLLINIGLRNTVLKASAAVSRDLIDVDGNPEINVMQRDERATGDKQVLPYRIRIDLENEVRVSFGQVDIPLAGGLDIVQGSPSYTEGTLRLLSGGHVPLFGKPLEISGGKLILSKEQPGNPMIDIALIGRTPEGEDVPVTVTGTLREPSTQPPPSELEALLGSATGTALSGGLDALGVNRLLGEQVGSFELRIDSTEDEAEDPRYAAAFRVSERIWFEGSYQKGQSTGVNTATDDMFAGTVDYRFRRNWSLKTEVGNTGGSVDLQWQHRY